MRADWPDTVRVGVMGGTGLPGNVRTLLVNLRNLLDDHPTTFEWELVVRDGIDVPSGYSAVDPGIDDTSRAIGTLRTLFPAVSRYARTADIDLLFQVTKFPIHGSVITTAGRLAGVPTLARYAGSNFGEHRFIDGVEGVKVFGLNNVVGQLAVHLAERVIVLGPNGREAIASRRRRGPIDTIPQPINRELFNTVSCDREREIANKLGFPDHGRTLLSVGRLSRLKGMKTLTRAAHRLTDEDVDFTWYVAGEGPMRSALEATPNVETLGRVPYGKMADYYRACDLVVHPSLTEGLPNVLLEAAACGTPSVARDVGDNALVASTVFTDPTALPALVRQEYDSISLDRRFDPIRLRERYADAIIRTAMDTA